MLDGANDYIELPNACLPVGPEITISFWARGGQSLPNQSCVFYAASGNMERSVCIHAPWDDGVIYFDCGPGDRIEKQGNAADFRGRFTHWAFTKNVTTGEMKIYLDGALWHSGVNKKAPICAAGAKVNFVAAARMQPGLNADYHYDGCLSDLQIWSRALSADEIQSVMYAVPSPNDADLMGHWPLGAIIEGTPRTVLDFSVHGNDGILRRDGTTAGGAYVSAVSLPRTLSSAPPDATTTPTSVLNFDGRDDYVALPAMNIDWSQGLTIEAWVRYESFNQYARIVDFSNGAGNANIIVFNDQNHPTLGAQNLTSQGNPRISLDNSLQAGVWTHVAVTVEKPGIGKLYKNGQVITSGPLLLPDNVNRVNCWIAKSAWGSDGYFQGQMAELRVWKTPRTQADIQRDMGQRLTGAEDGLVGYWPLDEGSGGIASDRVRRSGGVGSLPGTISGATWQSASWPLDRPAVPAPPPISVVKYDNSDLFPVAANATYREEFEFKIDAPYAYNPYNIDGGYPIFQFSYWGRRNRSSEGAPTIIPAGTPSFTDVGGGWWRASCQVTIPAGIGFLRLFEIANFTWPFGARGNLEVRKHKISLTSEAITEEQRIETLSAAAVPVAGSAQQKLLTLQRTQRDLAALEQQEGRLLLEQAALEVKKARIRDLTALTIDTVALTQKVEGLKREAQRLLDIYNNALANPLNYFCTLQVQLSSGEWQWVTGALYGFVIPQTTRGARVRFTPAGDLYRLSFEVAPNDW
ncbi:LamG domain-containing protein, partial [Haliangium sp. UPWRP_2]|uniref:LamG domain-containing protein n=1 Tax=Haliangium sp. UPWRP_2 TaxID=1931276 RepID=UPI0018EDCA76